MYIYSKEELKKAYTDIKNMHRDEMKRRGFEPKIMLWETELPKELKPKPPEELKPERHKSRDEYRIVMTMILSPMKGDKQLTKCLGMLFNRYPDFESMKNITKPEIKKLLVKEKDGGIGLGFSDPARGGNGARLWSFLECYFGTWQEVITPENINELNIKSGFGPKNVRTLKAYCLGEEDVLPLDTRAFEALQAQLPRYKQYGDSAVREEIESQLAGEPGISLIDFHEMLRFRGQTVRKGKRALENVIIGWNAWRLLCSKNRDMITNQEWICKKLIKDKRLAEELLAFYHKITK